MSEKKQAPVADLSYEAARDELQSVVSQLEAGSVSLEESMTLWERAEALSARCEEQLGGARKKLDAVIEAKQK
jgi:exodeoxyribonuclease VII small subunit